MSDGTITAPRRADGSEKVFWYDPEGGHIIWRRQDGTYEAIGWECRHPVATLAED